MRTAWWIKLRPKWSWTCKTETSNLFKRSPNTKLSGSSSSARMKFHSWTEQLKPRYALLLNFILNISGEFYSVIIYSSYTIDDLFNSKLFLITSEMLCLYNSASSLLIPILLSSKKIDDFYIMLTLSTTWYYYVFSSLSGEVKILRSLYKGIKDYSFMVEFNDLMHNLLWLIIDWFDLLNSTIGSVDIWCWLLVEIMLV